MTSEESKENNVKLASPLFKLNDGTEIKVRNLLHDKEPSYRFYVYVPKIVDGKANYNASTDTYFYVSVPVSEHNKDPRNGVFFGRLYQGKQGLKRGTYIPVRKVNGKLFSGMHELVSKEFITDDSFNIKAKT